MCHEHRFKWLHPNDFVQFHLPAGILLSGYVFMLKSILFDLLHKFGKISIKIEMKRIKRRWQNCSYGLSLHQIYSVNFFVSTIIPLLSDVIIAILQELITFVTLGKSMFVCRCRWICCIYLFIYLYLFHMMFFTTLKLMFFKY